MSAPLAATALEALHCVLIHSRSAEDIALLPLLRTAARRGDGTGTFVELGASDGESGSQTFLVERCFGWRGVLIEANPWSYAQIADKQRSRAVTFHSGVCSLSDKQEVGYIDMYSGNGSVTGNPATMDKRFRAQWSHVLGNVVHVPCRPLGTIMASGGLPLSGSPATFLSLDVEGAEEVVLQSIALWPRHPFSVMLVEASIRNNPGHKNARVMQMLNRSETELQYLPPVAIPPSPASVDWLFALRGLSSESLTTPYAPKGKSHVALLHEKLSRQMAPGGAWHARLCSGEHHCGRDASNRPRSAHTAAHLLAKSVPDLVEKALTEENLS